MSAGVGRSARRVARDVRAARDDLDRARRRRDPRARRPRAAAGRAPLGRRAVGRSRHGDDPNADRARPALGSRIVGEAGSSAVAATSATQTSIEPAVGDAPRPNGATESPTVAATDGAPFELTPIHAVAVWAIGALLLLALLVARYVGFLWRLRDRRPLHGELGAELDRMATATGVGRPRLTVSRIVAAPVSFSLPRAEICVPQRALDRSRLGGTARDPRARARASRAARPAALAGLGACSKPRSFTNRCCGSPGDVSSRCRRRCADEWAVERTGRRHELARALTVVASWVAQPAYRGVPIAQMAACRSALARRVERLLAPAHSEARHRATTTVAVAGLVAVALIGPGIGCRSVPKEQGPAPVLALDPDPEARLGTACADRPQPFG